MKYRETTNTRNAYAHICGLAINRKIYIQVQFKRYMNMQDNLIAIVAAVTAAVVLLAIFISTVDTYYQQSQLDSINVEQDAFDLDPICNPCPNNSDFYHIGVLKGSQNISNTYMFVNLVDFASNLCCNIIGKPESEVVLSDIRGNVIYCIRIHIYMQCK